MIRSAPLHRGIMSAFATYRTFTDPEEAEAMVQLLDHAGIPYRIDRARPVVDMSFDPDRTQERILLFLPPEHFADADRAQEAAIPEEPASAYGDHYLRDFSDAELLEILCNAQEWNPGDVVVARRLLAARGVEVDPQTIASRREEVITARRQPVKGSKIMIATGFLLVPIGGLLAIALGWSFATFKERDPDGKEFYKYDEATRTLGKWMMGLGIACFVAWSLA